MRTITNDKLQCALGVHRFDKKITDDTFRCSICERADYYKASKGHEYWYEYDEKGNEIHYRNSSGLECWSEYNEKGNMIHRKNSYGNGKEEWYEYETGRMIHYRNSNGYESWIEYDEKGNEIHFRVKSLTK